MLVLFFPRHHLVGVGVMWRRRRCWNNKICRGYVRRRVCRRLGGEEVLGKSTEEMGDRERGVLGGKEDVVGLRVGRPRGRVMGRVLFLRCWVLGGSRGEERGREGCDGDGRCRNGE